MTTALLTKTDARAIGTFPWTKHPSFTDVSKCTNTTEAIKNSKLNWTVRTEPLFLKDGRGVNGKAVVRDDNNTIIADYVGPDWLPVQNVNKFNWFDPYLQNNDSTLLHAGYIGNGEKVCLIARLNHNTNTEITKGDEVAKYLLLTDSFVYGKSLKIILMIARLVCGNGMVSFDNTNHMMISHYSKINTNLTNAHQDIALWDESFKKSIETAIYLAHKKVKNNAQLVEYFTEAMDFEEREDKKTGIVKLSTRSNNVLEKLKANFEDDTYNGKERSLWNAYNAITAYLNHENGRSQDSALDSLWFGSSALKQKRAMALAIDYANAI